MAKAKRFMAAQAIAQGRPKGPMHPARRRSKFSRPYQQKGKGKGTSRQGGARNFVQVRKNQPFMISTTLMLWLL